jgi:tripartite-type tricarboxylate transporter receptor subunit TctC
MQRRDLLALGLSACTRGEYFMKRRDFLTLGAATLAAPAMSKVAFGQTKYPDRPIRLVIPYPPGGVYDGTGRPWADKAKAHLGTIVIENIGGAGSTLGTAAAARAKPDGYTILLGGNSGLVINPIAATRPLYDPQKDFEPIAVIGRNATAIVVNPKQPMRTLKELIAYAKANPGKLSYGSSGVGTPNHLIGERLKSLTGIGIAHVPYRGAGPAMTDLISGHIPLTFQSVSGQAIEMHRTGQQRILAVTSEKRLTSAPEVPTVAEAGMPDLTARQFLGLFAPAGTPKDIVERIAAVARGVMTDKDLQRIFDIAGFDPELSPSPEKTRQILSNEIATWTPVIRAIGLKLD